jgi:uncharacterized membrane protein YhaH (DUF805 family)
LIWLAPLHIINTQTEPGAQSLAIIAVLACLIMLLLFLIRKGMKGDNRFGSNSLAANT